MDRQNWESITPFWHSYYSIKCCQPQSCLSVVMTSGVAACAGVLVYCKFAMASDKDCLATCAGFLLYYALTAMKRFLCTLFLGIVLLTSFGFHILNIFFLLLYSIICPNISCVDRCLYCCSSPAMSLPFQL